MYHFIKIVSIACLVCFVAGIFLVSTGNSVFACSRVLSANNGQAVLVARNMDWPVDMGTALWMLPRGIKRDGMAGKNSLVWTAKYASLVTASLWLPNGKGAVSDGVNEKGLVANALWLDPSDYGVRDESLPGLSLALWTQYVLDNYTTVDEAVQAVKDSPYQVVTRSLPVTVPGAGTTMATAVLHLSLADKSGDSAIIEYIDGKPVIYHDRNYTIMTNQPSFNKQQENLKAYQGFGGDKPLPGTSKPEDRFVRAAYYMKVLPKPTDLRSAIAGILSVTRSASQPFSVSLDPKNPYTAATIWTSVADLTNGSYYFALATSPSIIWADFSEFNLAEGASAMKLDLRNNPDYTGNVAKQFVPGNLAELIPD
ncbi:MAG TPA: linear amide C-N hydrolase [Negativicutes bacterium]|nr:linear amide C-N hydrolase [Negativicutes bacterium]